MAMPVATNARRAVFGSSCARAIAVVSSITSCDSASRRSSGPARSDASEMP